MHNSTIANGAKVIDAGVKRTRRHQTDGTYLAGLLAELADDPTSSYSAELAADHHFNRNHPDYDPNCFCGSPVDPNMDAAAAAATEFDHNDDTWQGRQAVSEGRRGRKPMSPGQADYLKALCDQVAARIADPSLVKTIQDVISGKTTWAEASALIDRIRQQLNHTTRPNAYPGTCTICGQHVAAQAGNLSKDKVGRWVVEHDGECPEPTEEPTLEEQAAAAAPTAGLDLSTLPAGRYAVPGGDTRLKVQVDKPSRGNWKGHIFVRDAAVYGQGRRYGSQKPAPYRYQGDIVEELEAIMADPAAAMAAYGHLTGTCGRCYRHLEDETSISLGIGPVCRAKLAAEVG